MDEIVGKPFWPRWARWGYFAWLVLVVAMMVWAFRPTSVGTLVCWCLLGLAFLRGPARVTRDGVVVPRIGKWKRHVGWDEVESVAPPGRFEKVTTLLLTNGRDVPLEGITEEWAHSVAELGGKPVRERRSKPFAPLPPSPAEVERDLRRRSETLAVEDAVLREELERIRRKP